jgi:hypothetical protein
VVENNMFIYYCDHIEYFGEGGKFHRIVKYLPWLPRVHAYAVDTYNYHNSFCYIYLVYINHITQINILSIIKKKYNYNFYTII